MWHNNIRHGMRRHSTLFCNILFVHELTHTYYLPEKFVLCTLLISSFLFTQRIQRKYIHIFKYVGELWLRIYIENIALILNVSSKLLVAFTYIAGGLFVYIYIYRCICNTHMRGWFFVLILLPTHTCIYMPNIL